ncbi:hypothetical protein LCGC14_0378270 [marine sediment metagenome]|uniref:Uncharacterized protein n=1 Tax=marine sediment metagenome TaxID=412755 RepID=A0A0F9WBY7_9ZZZZ
MSQKPKTSPRDLKNKPKVLLIYPNQVRESFVELYQKHRFPNIGPRSNPMINLGMLYIVAAIRDICDCQYIDNNTEKLSTHDLTQYILKQKPDIVGFGGTLTEWPQASQVAASLKEQAPDITTCYGGPNASANPTKHVKYFDFVFRGWAEQSFREFVLRMSKSPNAFSIEGIPGLCWRDQTTEDPIGGNEGCIVPPALNINLDDVKYPARDVIDIENYKRVQFPTHATQCCDGKGVCQSPVDVVVASRGCPHACSFCSSKSIWQQRHKTRPAAFVADEIRMMQRLYSTKTIHFRGDNTTANATYLESLCKELKTLHNETGLTWICQSRINVLSRPTIRMMKKAGCRVICAGFESANDETLQAIDKGFLFKDVVHAIENLEREEMFYSGGFIVGAPNEGEKEIERTLLFTRNVSRLPHSFIPRGAGRLVGWPVSEMYNEMLANPELIAFNWQCGEQIISNTRKLSAAQVESCIARHW